MEIYAEKDFKNSLNVKASGKLDIESSAEYGMKIKDILEDDSSIKELVLDFSGITYVASIGLRVLLELFQYMDARGTMRVTQVQDPVLNVFKMTGFDKFLNIILFKKKIRMNLQKIRLSII